MTSESESVDFVEYGLMATFKIDDAQTPMSKCHVAVAKQAFVIRPSVAKSMRHAQNDLFIHLHPRIKIDYATDTTHSQIPGSVRKSCSETSLRRIHWTA
jgi:hypothetical protein